METRQVEPDVIAHEKEGNLTLLRDSLRNRAVVRAIALFEEMRPEQEEDHAINEIVSNTWSRTLVYKVFGEMEDSDESFRAARDAIRLEKTSPSAEDG